MVKPPEETESNSTESAYPMPPSLSALLQSGDYPSPQLLGRTTDGDAPPSRSVPLQIAPLISSRNLRDNPSLKPSSKDNNPTLESRSASIDLEGRDPFSLWVHWHVPNSEVPKGRNLRLRLFTHCLEGPWMLEQPVADSGHRTIPVLYADTVYIASLGIVLESGAWHSLAISAPVRTAPEVPKPSWTSVMALFPDTEPATESPIEMQKPGERSKLITGEAPVLTDDATAGPFAVWASEALEWSPDANSSGSFAKRPTSQVQIEGIGAHVESLSPGSPVWTPAAGIPGSVPVPSPTSLAPTGFWFRVHAELVLHGSTEPGASVTIGGRPVRLRDDGSFTFRFSLPNGSFNLPVTAVKSDGSDRRSADLTFTRHTVQRGDVGVHPIDPSLKPPVAGSVS